jgi:hypothetical protein
MTRRIDLNLGPSWEATSAVGFAIWGCTTPMLAPDATVVRDDAAAVDARESRDPLDASFAVAIEASMRIDVAMSHDGALSPDTGSGGRSRRNRADRTRPQTLFASRPLESRPHPPSAEL